MDAGIREIKRRERVLRKGRKAALRDQRKMHRRDRYHQWICFWTWPFGHAWYEVEGGKRCTACFKGKTDSPNPSGPSGMSVRSRV